MHGDELAVDSGDTMISLLKLIQSLARLLVLLISLLKLGGDTTIPSSEGLEIADNVAAGIALRFNGAVVMTFETPIRGPFCKNGRMGIVV